jgi:hypothetical protein
VTAALAACSVAPGDPVEALLAELEAAAEARDAERFGRRLSEGFEGLHGLGRGEALAQLRRYFAAYESVAVESWAHEVERDGPSARVRCVVEFSGAARRAFGLEGLLPPEAVYRFELDVAEEGGVWRVRRAAWEAAGEPGKTM